MRQRSRPVQYVLIALISTVGVVACEESIDPAPPTAEETTQSDPIGDVTRRGGGSSLGKAKQSAENTVGKLEERDKEILKQIDEDNK